MEFRFSADFKYCDSPIVRVGVEFKGLKASVCCSVFSAASSALYAACAVQPNRV